MVPSPRGTLAYLAMEYLSGAPLTRWLEAGPLPPVRAAAWLLEAAAAVDYAHRSGVLHRDLKPDNIWVEELPGGTQRVKVLDFGLAKTVGPAPEPEAPRNLPPVIDAISIAADLVEIVEQEERGTPAARPSPVVAREGEEFSIGPRPPTLSFEIDLSEVDDLTAVSRRLTLPLDPPARVEPDPPRSGTRKLPAEPEAPRNLTELGTVMGTPAYMSPEQATGLGATRASDVYALGVIAFEMVTGDVPFHGTTAELLRHHRDDAAPDPGSRVRGLPRSMRRAVMSALSKSPEARPATALGFARAFAGSLSIDRLAGRAIVLYLSLVALWILSRAMLSPWIPDVGPERASALRALAAANLTYFLAASLALLLVEARREEDPIRLWPLCVLAFPLTPVWLFLVWRSRQEAEE
jgi:serine/threonine protein kinase